MKRHGWLDYLVYLALRTLICVIQALRMETCEVLARYLASLMCTVLQIRRHVVDENLSHAFPELSAPARRELAWRMWEHLFLLLAEIAHAPRKIHDTNWRDYITPAGRQTLVRAILD